MSKGIIDYPAAKIKGKLSHRRGFNIKPLETAMERDKYLRPLGLALEKEFGSRISDKEIEHKLGAYTMRSDGFIFSVGKELWRLNKRINKMHQQQVNKHLK